MDRNSIMMDSVPSVKHLNIKECNEEGKVPWTLRGLGYVLENCSKR